MATDELKVLIRILENAEDELRLAGNAIASCNEAELPAVQQLLKDIVAMKTRIEAAAPRLNQPEFGNREATS